MSEITSWMVRRGRIAVLESVRPVFAAIYHLRSGNCPDWMLRALGIITPEIDPGFTSLARLLDTTPTFPGAIIECGVAKGASLMGLMHRLYRRGVRGVTFYGLDSFEGFPEPHPVKDARITGRLDPWVRRGYLGNTSRTFVAWRIHAMRWPYEVHLVKGFFDKTLSAVARDKWFVLAHLDCDLYGSYRTCLQELYPRMLPGGVMVFDEYGPPNRRYPGARRAIDEFLADKPEKVQHFADLPRSRHFIRKV